MKFYQKNMDNTSKLFSNGYTYDDVLLCPNYSEITPNKIDISSRLSRNISLNIPIISAAMDTVTESSMAIAMAQEGGIGVLHKNMSIKKQIEEVRRVKRSESGMILDPIVLEENAKVIDAKKVMQKHSIGGIPIVDKNKNIKGVVTNRDLRFEKNNERNIIDLMTPRSKLITAEKGISLTAAEKILEKYKIEKLPIIDKDDKLIGLITFRDIIKQNTKPVSNKDTYGRLRVGATIGVTKDFLERAEGLIKAEVDCLFIDTAHAHSKGVGDVLKNLKKSFSSIDVIVGNIVTSEAAKYLIDLGADAVKVGIGPGSICTTRVIAGVGYPQLSAIVEVAKICSTTDVPLIADGGIKYTGDITKAIAAGADSVMLGSMLAGTKESPGETVIYEGRRFKTYRGMGSLEAMQKGSKDRYFQENNDNKKLVPEGIVGRVPYKGELQESIQQFTGGLKSGMGYCGSKNIKELKEKRKFIIITPAGRSESHPHNIQITKEAPNYSSR